MRGLISCKLDLKYRVGIASWACRKPQRKPQNYSLRVYGVKNLAARKPKNQNGWGEVEDVFEKEYSQAVNSEIGPILNAYDICRRLLRANDVSQFIPEIVVIGDQSSGKSSLLETISGISLPRGDGMVTKVPLELQLRTTEQDKQGATLTYLNAENQQQEVVISNLTDISRHILEAQDALVGENQQNIQDNVIQLQISSPNLPNLTMTDQPGLIQNTMPGQPKDLPTKIKDLAEKHTKGQSKIVLCIVPGNVDPSTCLALDIAEKQDPQNERTICVITKVDMGLKSEFNIGSVVKLLETKGYEYVAVRNRTSKEVEAGLSLPKLRKIEVKMISSQLKGIIPEEYCGVKVLITRLIEIQRNILVNSFDNVILKVETALQEVEDSLANLPPQIANQYQAHNLVARKIKEVQEDLYALSKKPQDNDYQSLIVDNQQFTTSAILQIEFKCFINQICNLLKHPQFLDSDQLDSIIQLTKPFSGTQLPNFPVYEVPAYLYEHFLWSMLKKPSNNLIDRVHQINEQLLFEIVEARCGDYPKLVLQLKNIVKDMLKNMKQETCQKLDYLVQLEKEPYTQDSTYINDLKNWEKFLQHQIDDDDSDDEDDSDYEDDSDDEDDSEYDRDDKDDNEYDRDDEDASEYDSDDEDASEYDSDDENDSDYDHQESEKIISFGIATIIPELGASWEKQAHKLADFVKNNQTSENMEAVTIMMSLAAIAGVLFRRFIDNVCLMLRYTYLKELPNQFVEDCGINEDQAWRLVRNEGVENRRARLEKERQNYTEALEQLRRCY